MKGRKLSDVRQAEELWITAYMGIFDLDRRNVPSPCMP